MIYAIITISITTHPPKRTTTKLRFKKGFHEGFLCIQLSWICKFLQTRLASCQPFWNVTKYIYQNVNSSIRITKRFCFCLSRILFLPMFAHKNSCLCQVIRRHFSSFNFMQLAWKHSIACSNLVTSFISECKHWR